MELVRRPDHGGPDREGRTVRPPCACGPLVTTTTRWRVYTYPVNRMIEPADLVDARTVAGILGLAQRSSVSVYQRRYARMPRPVVDLGPGRPNLWSRRAIEEWAESEGPKTVTSFIAGVLAGIPRGARGSPQNLYRSFLRIALAAALGPKPGEPSTVAEAHLFALEATRKVDATFDWPAPPELPR